MLCCRVARFVVLIIFEWRAAHFSFELHSALATV
jgi:hypothetical protein